MTLEYSSYRPSDIGWVDRVPADWRTIPFRAVFVESNVKNVGMEESNLLSLSYGSIVRKDIGAVDGLLPASFETYQIVEPNTLVFRFTDLQNDQRSLRSSRVTERGIITSAYTAVRPVGISARFAAYLMRSYDMNKVFYGLGGGVRQSLKFADVARLPVLLPSPVEQSAIADYLDRETARIDTLIEEQQRLIELLRERRSALISHAVLDVTSKRTQLRRLVDVIDCAHVTAEFVDGHERFPVASIRECQGPTVDLSACAYTTAEFFNHLRSGNRAPRTGDLLFIRNVSVGLVSVVPPDLPEFAMGQETVLLRRKSEVDPEFLRYVLIGAEARHEIEGAMIGSTFRRINVSAIRSLPVAIPPISEQRRIAALLDEQTAQIDELVAEAERFIELSRERRAALITAAVTGQIDVREVA